MTNTLIIEFIKLMPPVPYVFETWIISFCVITLTLTALIKALHTLVLSKSFLWIKDIFHNKSGQHVETLLKTLFGFIFKLIEILARKKIFRVSGNLVMFLLCSLAIIYLFTILVLFLYTNQNNSTLQHILFVVIIFAGLSNFGSLLNETRLSIYKDIHR